VASHVAHLLFAEESARRSSIPVDRQSPYFVLGAQGPDLFLHSQRRKPRGIQYGGLLHRKGFPTFAALLAGGSDEAREYAAGFVTHVVLDRVSHPFINYFAGWWDRSRPETRRYQHMHPFLERLIDIELLERKEGRHPKELSFYRLVDCGSELPRGLQEELRHALAASVESARRDEELIQRLRNAYADSMGYYRHTSEIGEAYMKEARRREEAEEISDRWLSLIHPPTLPYKLDVLNLRRRQWCHPCDSDRRSNESFLDLWEAAISRSAELLRMTQDAGSEDGRKGLRSAREYRVSNPYVSS